MTKIASDWKDYEIIASGDGQKLERWGEVFLLRPDPQAIWRAQTNLRTFKGLHAAYNRESSGGGAWEILQSFAPNWNISYKDMVFKIMPMGFKHTGLFPEQAVNWQLMQGLCKGKRVLNLFAYTGAASIACAKAGASVCQVDASKGMTQRAQENARLNGIDNIRFIVDDCAKFVQREIRRGNTYDAIIMDPPSYGRGPQGEKWKLEDNLYDFVELCAQLLSENPAFFLLNSYTTGLSASVMSNILTLCVQKNHKGSTEAYDLCLPTKEKIVMPCGASALFVGK